MEEIADLIQKFVMQDKKNRSVLSLINDHDQCCVILAGKSGKLANAIYEVAKENKTYFEILNNASMHVLFEMLEPKDIVKLLALCIKAAEWDQDKKDDFLRFMYDVLA